MIDLKQVCRTIEAKRCRTHNEHPKAIVSGKDIKLTTCCSNFQKELEKVVKDELSKQAEKSINDIFKKFR